MGTLNANTKLLSIQINILNNTFSVFLMLSLIKIICKKNSYALLHTGKIGETFFLQAWKTHGRHCSHIRRGRCKFLNLCPIPNVILYNKKKSVQITSFLFMITVLPSDGSTLKSGLPNTHWQPPTSASHGRRFWWFPSGEYW